MGRNGMGKTTLIRSLVGHLPPRRGEIKIHGVNMTRALPHRIARRGIAYVPEGRGIFPNLTVKENLIMAARSGAGGRTDWTYKRVLETFPRLAERLSHGGQQLSGGEQQMLAIGRALMTNPTLLILDEATEGLAPLIAQEIWRIIRTVRETGIAAIIVDKNFSALSQTYGPQHYSRQRQRGLRRQWRCTPSEAGIAASTLGDLTVATLPSNHFSLGP